MKNAIIYWIKQITNSVGCSRKNMKNDQQKHIDALSR